MKPDPLDNPTRNQATLGNLVNNMRLLHAMPLLQELTFDQVTELWWAAQRQKADHADWQHARIANPNSMVGKSPEYVAAWQAKQRQASAPVDVSELEAQWPDMSDLEGGVDVFGEHPVAGEPLP